MCRIQWHSPSKIPVADRCISLESRVVHTLISRMFQQPREPSHFPSVSFPSDEDDYGQWLRLLCPLLLLISFLPLLPRLATPHIPNPTSHAPLRHALHVAKGPGTPRKSFLGQSLRCSSPHLDKLLFSSTQSAPRSTWVGQPYWALRLKRLKS